MPFRNHKGNEPPPTSGSGRSLGHTQQRCALGTGVAQLDGATRLARERPAPAPGARASSSLLDPHPGAAGRGWQGTGGPARRTPALCAPPRARGPAVATTREGLAAGASRDT